MGAGRDGAEVAQHVLGVRARPLRRAGTAPARAPRARGRGRGSAAAAGRAGSPSTSSSSPRSEARVIGRPPRPATTSYTATGQAAGGVAGCSARRCRRRRPRTPSPRRPPACARLSASRTSSTGQGRKQVMPSAPIAHALVAQVVDDVLDRAEHRAQGDDHGLGVLEPVRLEQPAGARGRTSRRKSAAISGDLVEGLPSAWRASGTSPRRTPPARPWRRSSPGRRGRAPAAGRTAGRKASTCSCVGRSTSSKAWVSTKPSMQTITGTDSDSASRKAWTCRSTASWLDSA